MDSVVGVDEEERCDNLSESTRADGQHSGGTCANHRGHAHVCTKSEARSSLWAKKPQESWPSTDVVQTASVCRREEKRVGCCAHMAGRGGRVQVRPSKRIE